MVDHGLPAKEDIDPRDGLKHEKLSVKSWASRQHGTERMLKHIHTAHAPLHHRILEAALYAGNALKTMVDGSAAGTEIVLVDGTHGGEGWEQRERSRRQEQELVKWKQKEVLKEGLKEREKEKDGRQE